MILDSDKWVYSKYSEADIDNTKDYDKVDALTKQIGELMSNKAMDHFPELIRLDADGFRELGELVKTQTFEIKQLFFDLLFEVWRKEHYPLSGRKSHEELVAQKKRIEEFREGNYPEEYWQSLEQDDFLDTEEEAEENKNETDTQDDT